MLDDTEIGVIAKKRLILNEIREKIVDNNKKAHDIEEIKEDHNIINYIKTIENSYKKHDSMSKRSLCKRSKNVMKNDTNYVMSQSNLEKMSISGGIIGELIKRRGEIVLNKVQNDNYQKNNG